jgi:lysophospholipase L1-like esterase
MAKDMVKSARFFNALIFFISLLVAFTLGEVIVRLSNLAPQLTFLEISKPYGDFMWVKNPEMKYVPKPNSGDINSYGIRDTREPLSKNNAFRIVVLGDSIAYGLCTDSEKLSISDTFPKVLEKKMEKKRKDFSKPIEVFNLGVSGYDTAQEAAFLKEKGVGLEPDLVVIAYCLNDAWTASGELNAFKVALPPAIIRKLISTSAFLRLIWYRSFLLKDKIRETLSPFSKAMKKKLFKKLPRGQNFSHDRVSYGFEKIAQMAKQYKFRVLVVIFPLFNSGSEYEWMAEHQGVKEKAEKYGFDIIDLLPEYKQFSKAAGFGFQDFQGRCNREHPDEKGHRVAAEAIQKYLEENSLA